MLSALSYSWTTGKLHHDIEENQDMEAERETKIVELLKDFVNLRKNTTKTQKRMTSGPYSSEDQDHTTRSKNKSFTFEIYQCL